MRTDVKVGLICLFAIVLGVVIYFVAQGNAHPQKAQAGSPAGATGTIGSGTSSAKPDTGPTVASPTAVGTSDRTIASAGGAGGIPGSPGSVGGGVIAPPSAPSTITIPSTLPATTSPASASTATPSMGAGGSAAPGAASGTLTNPSSSIPGSSTLNTSGSLIPPSSSGSSTPGGTSTGNSYSGNSPTLQFGTPPSVSARPEPTPSLFDRSTRSGAGSSSLSSSGGNSGMSGSSSSGSANTYKIQKGDMLGTIAKKYNVSVKAIEAANPGIDSNRLKIDHVINIPAPSASSSTPTASARGTPDSHSGAAASTVSASAARRTPAASSTSTGTHTASASIKPGSTYTVKKGDTLSTIAESAYGNKGAWQRIFRANRGELADANSVKEGVVLQIPQ